jgi:hypothetical protein
MQSLEPESSPEPDPVTRRSGDNLPTRPQPSDIRPSRRSWIGSALLLAGGVGALVILMLGWAITRWWNGEVHALSETLLLCGWIMFGLIVVLSLLWLGNSLEQRFQPARPQKADTWLDWKTFITVGLALMAMKAGERAMQPTRGPFVTPPLRGQAANHDSASFVLQQNRQRQATAAYWQTAVANLHGTRFRPPKETESLPEVFERLTRDFRQKIALARAAATANVDPELVAMVQRHLEQDDRLLTVLAQIPQLMQTYQVGWGTESAGQRALQWQQFQARLIAQPELWKKLPPETRQLIEDVVALEAQQQMQFREIELLQAVLQERYRGVVFPLPSLDP